MHYIYIYIYISLSLSLSLPSSFLYPSFSASPVPHHSLTTTLLLSPFSSFFCDAFVTSTHRTTHPSLQVRAPFTYNRSVLVQWHHSSDGDTQSYKHRQDHLILASAGSGQEPPVYSMAESTMFGTMSIEESEPWLTVWSYPSDFLISEQASFLISEQASQTPS